MERLGIIFKTHGGRFLTPVGRAAVRLERALLGRSLDFVARRYGLHRATVSTLAAGLPRYDEQADNLADVVAAVRARWLAEEDPAGVAPKLRFDLVLADAYALVLDAPDLSAEAMVGKVMADLGMTFPVNKENAHAH